MSERSIRAATLAVLAALAAFCFLRLEPTSSITHFLPSGDEAELAELSRRLVESELSRNMVLRVVGEGDRARAAADLAAFLAEHPEVAWVQGQEDEAFAEALFRLYFPRRVYLASDQPEVELPALLEPAALRQRAEGLRARLAGPAAPLLTRQAPEDPLGLFATILERARAAQPAAAADGSYVFLRTRPSAFDSEPQARLLADIEERFRQAAAAHGPALGLEQGGVNRIALASERSIRRDVNFISSVSLLGVAALFLLFFRSPRSLALALLPPALGVAAAAALASLAFAPVHGVTLGFGLSLIGVGIDYPIHPLNHHALSAEGATPRATLARIRRALVLGGGTTALSFGVLALSDFPGVDDMGTFAAVGVLVALAATLLCLPAFLPRDGRVLAARSLRSASRVLSAAVRKLARRRRAAAGVPLLFAAIAIVGVPRIQWQDDPGALSSPDPALLQEDRRVRSGAADLDMERFVVARGATPEAALARNDRVYLRLREAIAAGHLDGVRSLHAVLWSQELQLRNRESLRAQPDLAGRIDAAYREAGFRPGAFAGFSRELGEPAAPPLQPEDLAGTPLAGLLGATLVSLNEGWGVITYLRGVRAPDAIRAALGGVEGAHYLDQGELLHEIFAGYRRSTLRLVALGSGLVFAVLLLRYRRLGQALLAFIPSALVALTTLGLLGLAGVPVNLLSVVSLILVMGMGVDYGVFAMECARDPQRLAPTMLGLLVSCLTTLFVFGTLAFSEHPALRSIGLTTGIGISLAFLASPAVLALAAEADPA